MDLTSLEIRDLYTNSILYRSLLEIYMHWKSKYSNEKIKALTIFVENIEQVEVSNQILILSNSKRVYIVYYVTSPIPL